MKKSDREIVLKIQKYCDDISKLIPYAKKILAELTI